MSSLSIVGISLTGAFLSAAVLSMLYPSGNGKKIYSAVTGVYLIIAFISSVFSVKITPLEDIKTEIVLEYESYGEELTLSYFSENIKTVINEKTGIDKADIFIELEKEDKKVGIKRVSVRCDSTKYLEELSEMLGTEIEVID